MAELKVVIDTNVIVSAVLKAGLPFAILELWRERKFDIVLSREVLEEYYTVVSREKFCLPASLIKTIIEELSSKAIWITKTSQIDLIKDDPSDNKFIETAIDGGANYIISGDPHLLNLKKHQNIGILTCREFIAQLKKMTHAKLL